MEQDQFLETAQSTVVLRCARGLGMAMLQLLLMTSAAHAQSVAECSQNLPTPLSLANYAESVPVMEQFEAAWNAHDVATALTLFSDNAIGASSSGMHWLGKAEMAGFLTEMWVPSRSRRSYSARIVSLYCAL